MPVPVEPVPPEPAPARRLPDLLNLKLNSTGYLAAAGAVYAAAAMVYNAHYHHGVLSTPVILAAIGAVAGLLIHTQVTPVAKPKGGNGNPLVPAAPVLTEHLIPLPALPMTDMFAEEPTQVVTVVPPAEGPLADS